MADLADATVFNPVYDNAQVPFKQLSAPVAADSVKGQPMKFNTTTGKLEKMVTGDSPFVFAGLLERDTKAGYMGVAFRGLAYMESLGSLTVGQVLALSANAGKIADGQTGVKAIARIVPLHVSGGTVTKMIEIFDLPITIA